MMCLCVVLFSSVYVLADSTAYDKLWDGHTPTPAPVPHQIHSIRLTIDQFEFHKVLGKGSFGKVRIPTHTNLASTCLILNNDWFDI